MSPDNEINALSNVYESLKGLNNAQIKRILEWITGKKGARQNILLNIKGKDFASRMKISHPSLS